MSADNYWRVCKHPVQTDKFTAVMGFASNEERAEPDDKCPAFDTVKEAYDYADQDAIIEYGIWIDPDCLEKLSDNKITEGK